MKAKMASDNTDSTESNSKAEEDNLTRLPIFLLALILCLTHINLASEVYPSMEMKEYYIFLAMYFI